MTGRAEIDLDWIARVTGASRARAGERVARLWSGYGEIVRVILDGAPLPSARPGEAQRGALSVVVKSVRPPPARGDDVSHARKCRSYAVESTFYGRYAERCDATCRVPRLLASRSAADRPEWLFVLEDLDAAGYPRRTHRPDESELGACLGWLASFHARFFGDAPDGLWRIGTYWHLATRAEELRAIDDDDEPLRTAAPRLNRMLAECTFQTFVHGDAKPANFCFADEGAVAAVDFQYVGGGCGMKDVAYLLDGESPEAAARLLDSYFVRLAAALARERPHVDARAVEREWRALYPIASADYLRFLAGWAKEHYRRDRSARARVASALRELERHVRAP